MRNGTFVAVMGLVIVVAVIGLVALSRVIDKQSADDADDLQLQYQIDKGVEEIRAKQKDR